MKQMKAGPLPCERPLGAQSRPQNMGVIWRKRFKESLAMTAGLVALYSVYLL
jgi:hypothetical protein